MTKHDVNRRDFMAAGMVSAMIACIATELRR